MSASPAGTSDSSSSGGSMATSGIQGLQQPPQPPQGNLDSAEADELCTALPLLLSSSAVMRQLLDGQTAAVCLQPSAVSGSSLASSQSLASTVSLSAALSSPYSSPHCSFASTSFRHAPQLWRPCLSCNLVDSNGCCAVCARVCHAGHQLGEERLTNFYCDCGSRGPAYCQCLPDDGRAEQQQWQPLHHDVRAARDAAMTSSEAAAASSVSELSPGLSCWLAASGPSASQAASQLLSVNKSLFRPEDRLQLPACLRISSVQMRAKAAHRRQSRRERKQQQPQQQQETAASTERIRPASFALAAFAECLEEMREDEEPQADAASFPILRAISHYVSKQPPLSVHLPAAQRPHHEKITRVFRSIALASPAASPASTVSFSALESALRMWLSVGAVSDRLDAVRFLLDCHCQRVVSHDALSPSLSSFLSSFLSMSARQQLRILRTSRSSHSSEISGKAVQVKAELFCSSLALTPPVPSSSSAAGLAASATASTHVVSGSASQQAGVFPSLTCSSDGSCLFLLCPRYGLLKLGTGQRGTVMGELMQQNAELALHVGGHIACVRGEDGEDALLLRSPLRPPQSLWQLDCRSLQVVDTVTLGQPQAEASQSASLFELEQELQSRTPSTSTGPHWQPLAPVLCSSSDFASLSLAAYRLIKQCLASSGWRLDDRFALSSTVYLTVTTAGIALVVEQPQQPDAVYQLRITTQARPMPILPDPRSLRRDGQAAGSSRLVTFHAASKEAGGEGETAVRLQVFELQTEKEQETGRESKEREQKEDREQREAGTMRSWRLVEEASMADFCHALPVPPSTIPSTAASTATGSAASSLLSSSSSSSSSILSASSPRCCDGCGLIDWRQEAEHVCLDGCNALRLCSLCHLHQRFNSPSHRSSHHMDHRAAAAPASSSSSSSATKSLLLSEVQSGVLYADCGRLVLLPPPLPSASLRHWRDFAPGDIVDVRDLYQKWYQADILAVDPVQKSVMVHYHGWHQKWDEWISVSLDRFAPRGSLSSQNRPQTDGSPAAAKMDSSAAAAAAAEAARQSPSQRSARVLQWEHSASAAGGRISHAADVLSRTRGQAFACHAATQQVWAVNEDGCIEHWQYDAAAPSASLHDSISAPSTSFSALSAASAVLSSIPVLSVDAAACRVQLTAALQLLEAAASARDSSEQEEELLCSALDFVVRLVRSSPAALLSQSSMSAAGELPLLERASSFLQTRLLSASSSSSHCSDRVLRCLLSLLVDGAELFFAGWTERLSFILQLSRAQPLPPRHRLALESFGWRYHAVFAGSLVDVQGSRAPQRETQAVEKAEELLICLREADEQSSSCCCVASPLPRTAVYALVVYLHELFVSLQVGSPLEADDRDVSGLVPFLSLSRSVLSQSNLLLARCLRREGAAPPVDALLSSSSVFHLLRPLLSWLPPVLELLAAAAQPLYVELDDLLQSVVLLLCRLSPARAADAAVSLPSLLSSLRQSRQLTALHSRQGLSHRALVPFARLVFSRVFRHFATVPAASGSGDCLMSQDDFIRFHNRCHAPVLTSQPAAAAGASTAAATAQANCQAVIIPLSGPLISALAPATASSAAAPAVGSGAGPNSAARIISISGPSDSAGGSSSPSSSVVPVTLVNSGGSREDAAGRQRHQQALLRFVASQMSRQGDGAFSDAADNAAAALATAASTASGTAAAQSASQSQPATPQSRPAVDSLGALPVLLLPSILPPPPLMAAAEPPSQLYQPQQPQQPQQPVRSSSSLPLGTSSSSAGQARLLFQRLVSAAGDGAAAGAVPGCLDLPSFLRFQLEQCRADPKAALEQLRVLQYTEDWTETDKPSSSSAPAAASSLPPLPLSASMLLSELQPVYSAILAHLYPSPAIIHADVSSSLSPDQLPAVVSVSSLPGVVRDGGGGVGVEWEEVIGRLMESQAHWSQHEQQLQHRAFLDRFIAADAQQQQRKRERKRRRRGAKDAEQQDSGSRHAQAVNASPPQLDVSTGGKTQTPALTAKAEAALVAELQQAAIAELRVGQAEVLLDDEALLQRLKESEEQRHKMRHDRPDAQSPSASSAVRSEAADEAAETEAGPLTRSAEEETQLKTEHDEKWQHKQRESVSSPADATASSQAASSQPSPTPSPRASPSPSPLPWSEQSASSIPLSEEIEEPAVCLSSLFLRCLSEMGGGQSKRRIESWREAVEAEKAYAAALLKHHGYTERAVRYSQSIPAVELLRQAVLSDRRGFRCLSHPTCPQWLRSVVQATFRDVRSPLLCLLRELDEDDEEAKAETESSRSSSTPASAAAAAATAATGLVSSVYRQLQSSIAELEEAKAALLAGLKGADSATELQRRLEVFQQRNRDIMKQMARSSRQAMEQQRSGNAHDAQPSSSSQASSGADGSLEDHVRVVTDFLSQLKEKESVMRREQVRSIRQLQVRLDASLLIARVTTNARFLVQHIDNIQLDVHSNMQQHQQQQQQQQHSSASTAAAAAPSPPPSASDASPASRRRHSLVAAPLSDQLLLQQPATHTGDDAEAAQTAPHDRGASVDLSMMRSFSTGPLRSGEAADAALASSLWSARRVSSSGSRAFSGRQFDSSWLSRLVHSDATQELQAVLQPAMQRYHTTALLRLRLVQALNDAFSQGYGPALLHSVIPALLPCLSRSKHASHLLYNSRLLLKEEEAQTALLSFYKHVVAAMDAAAASAPLPLSYASSSWLTLTRCLPLFNVDFLLEDAEAVIGSGVVSALWRWMSGIDAAVDRQQQQQHSRRIAAISSQASSAAASRTVTASHTRAGSVVQSQAALRPSSVSASPTPLTASYHLKSLMWQSYNHIALFYLAQHSGQQRQQLLQQEEEQDLSSASSAAVSASSRAGDAVVESLGQWYASALLGHLMRLSQQPPLLALGVEDGSLGQTADTGRLLLHFARLTQPVCTAAQLCRLLQLMLAAPPATQQLLVQIIGCELSKLTPREFDRSLTDGAAASVSSSASELQPLSAYAFVGLLFDTLGGYVEKASALSSLNALTSLFASRSTRASLPQRDSDGESAEHKQQLFEPPICLDEEETRSRDTDGGIGHRGRSRPSSFSSPQSAARRPAPAACSSSSAVLQSALSSGWSYQSWHPDAAYACNPFHPAITEELLLLLRTLCQDRHWRRLVLPRLLEPVLSLPAVVQTLTDAEREAAFPVSSGPYQSSASLRQAAASAFASLAVLGGWAFTLRKGAYVEVNMQGDFPLSVAAPSPSGLLASLAPSAAVYRGFVQALDAQSGRVTVALSTAQPRFHVRPFRSDAASQQRGIMQQPEATVRMDFSLDQLRSVPSVPAPNLNDGAAFHTTWAALHAALASCGRQQRVPGPAASSTASPLLQPTSPAALAEVARLTVTQLQRMVVCLLHSQVTMALRAQAACSSFHSPSQQQQQQRLSSLNASLLQPLSPPFSASLSSPLLDPLTLSPSSPAAAASALHHSPSFTTFSLQPATEGEQQQPVQQQQETWRLQSVTQPFSFSVSSASSLPVQSERASPSPVPAARRPVDYAAFLPSLLQLTSASPNYLFSLSPFAVDAAARQLSHRLHTLLSAEVQRKRRISSLATRFSRLASRAVSRAMSRAASGAATPAVQPARDPAPDSGSEQHGEAALPPLHSLPVFPQMTSQLPSPIVRRSIVIEDGDAATATELQPVASRAEVNAAAAAGRASQAASSSPARSSASPSPSSSFPHFIDDPSDPLHSQLWSPTPRVQQIIYALHRGGIRSQSTSSSAAAASAAHDAEQLEDDQQEDPQEDQSDDAAVDEDESQEMRVHGNDDDVGLEQDYADDGDFHLSEDEEQEDDDALDAIVEQSPLLSVSASSFAPSFSLSSASSSALPLILQHLSGLTAIGYPEHCARFALARSGGSLHDALEFLLSGEITLYEEYRNAAAASAAFQRLLERLGLAPPSLLSSAAAVLPAAALATLVSRHFATTTASERRLLINGIAALCEKQRGGVAELGVYDWCDARDLYGQWFLAQVLQVRGGAADGDRALVVHFFAWDDAYNERVAADSGRLRPASLLEQSWRRLEDERQHRRQKVYGPALHEWMQAERARQQPQDRERHHQLAAVHMHDPYSFPPFSSPAGRAKELSAPLDSSSSLVGACVHLTTECVELLHASLGVGVVELEAEYAVGCRLMVVDTVGKLCEAEITEVRGSDIRIHYPGWGGRWDETLPVTSSRIATKKGSNRRRPRSSQWTAVAGSAAQLFSLVGKVGIIREMLRVNSLGAAAAGGAVDGRGDDVAVRVEVLDDEYGSVISFWTRLPLLKRVDGSDAPSVQHSAILDMSQSQLTRTAAQAERSQLSRQAGDVLQQLLLGSLQMAASNCTAPAAAVQAVATFAAPSPLLPSSLLPSSLRELLHALPVVRRVRPPLYSSGSVGWSSDAYGGVGESKLCIAQHHIAAAARRRRAAYRWPALLRPVDAQSSGSVSPLHPQHPLQFVPAANASLDWYSCSQCALPRLGARLQCQACDCRICVSCSASSSATEAAPSASADESEQAQRSRALEEAERSFRPTQSGEYRERLALLTAMTGALFTAELASASASASSTARWLPSSTVASLAEQLSAALKPLLKRGRWAAGEAEAECGDDGSEGGVPLLSLLSRLDVVELKQGNRVCLQLERPDVDALLVSWIRTSQPSFELHFMHAAEAEAQPDISHSVSTPAAPPASALTAAAASSSAQRDREEAIQVSVSDTTTSSQRTAASAISQSARPGPSESSVVCQAVRVLPPQLSVLRSLPPLKAAGLPLLLPNPVYLQLGGLRHGQDELVDVTEDELHILVTPATDDELETAATMVELLLHIRRDCAAITDRQPDIAESVEGTLDDLFRLLQIAVHSFAVYLLALHAACPWPSAAKVRCVELVAHLLAELRAERDWAERVDSVNLQATLLLFKFYASEARLRQAAEKEAWPLYSSYTHRMMELLTVSACMDMELSLRAQFASRLQQQSSNSTQTAIGQHELTVAMDALCRAPSSSAAKEEEERSDATTTLTAYLQHHFPLPLRIVSGVVLQAEHLAQQPLQLSHNADCGCSLCLFQRGKDASTSEAVLLLDFHSPFWPLLLGVSPLRLPAAYRFSLLDEIINATTSVEKTQPEFIFSTAKDRALEANAATTAAASSAVPEEGSVLRQFFSQLSVTNPAHFRSKLSDIPFKALFKGAFHRGAQGTPGPFRQSLSDVCADLRQSSALSLLIPCPNFVHDTGLSRNSFILNPHPAVSLKDAHCLGLLMGIAVRSGGVLDLDIAAVVWKQLLEAELADDELADFDYTAWRALQFTDWSSPQQPMAEEDWQELHANLPWSTLASDGVTTLQLQPPPLLGSRAQQPRVSYDQRHAYAAAAVAARLHESRHVLNAVKAGLYCIIPRFSLSCLSWRELQHRVCGDSELDLELLARHTAYAPKKYSADSDIVRWLWAALRSFNAEDRGRFLQFCLARSRLPPVTSREGAWRMKVNVLEAANPHDLPSAETCFFNLNLPNYRSAEVLKEKLHLAITHCSSINS